MRAIILWDFDGVIADSMLECFYLTRRTIRLKEAEFKGVLGRNYYPLTLNEFRSARRHAITAMDFFACYLSQRIYGRQSGVFHAKILSRHRKLLHSCDELFYEERGKMSAKELSKKMRLYPGILQALSSLKEMGYSNVIMSARDSKSIRQWLKHYGVLRLFSLIVGNEVSRKDRSLKSKQVKLIRKKYPTGRLFFVDDMLFNLEQAMRYADLKPLFAGWGYGKWNKSKASALRINSPAGLLEFFRKGAVGNGGIRFGVTGIGS